MTVFELRAIQKRINFDAPSMAACLGVDREQYRRYYYGHAAIPANIERAALELEQINITFSEGIGTRIDERLKRDKTQGFKLN